MVALLSFAAINGALAQDVGNTVVVDEITTIDMGVENPGLLPTNPFYFLKEWGRGVRMIFTFNKVSKVGYELKVTNDKAAELKKVQELHPDNTVAIEKALNNYNKNALRLKTKIQSLEESSQNPKVDAILDKLAENTIRHQQLFEELKDKNEDLHEKFEDAEEGIEETLEHIVKNIDKPERAVERLGKALEGQKESQSKELRAVHLLNKFEEDIDSPEIIEKLSELKDKHIDKLEAKLKSGIIEPSRVGDLVKDISHDDIEIFEVLRELEEGLVDVDDELKLDDLEKEILDEANHKESDFVSRAKEKMDKTDKILGELGRKLSADPGTILGTERTELVDKLFKDAKHHFDLAIKAYEIKKYGEVFGHANSAYTVAKTGLGKLSGSGTGEKHEKILCLEGYVEHEGKCRAKKELNKEESKEEPMDCIQVYDPVCGADHKTYSNSCFAGLAHIEIKYKGTCGKPELERDDSIESEDISPINIPPDSIKVETKKEPLLTVSKLWDVGITDEGFSPAELRIKKGDMVVWTNKGSKSSWPASAMHPTHGVYPEKGGCIGSNFDACKGLGNGETFKFVFNQIGSWKYHDHLNSTHFGAIIVE